LFRRILFQGLRRLGLSVTRIDKMPYGLDYWQDIPRWYPGTAFRTLFDIGANIGRVTISMARRFPQAAIYSFEPVRETFAQLTANTGKYPGVKPYPFAFGASETTANIFPQANSEHNSLIGEINIPSGANGSNPPEAVSITTLDRFCADHGIRHIDFLKTDTEGFDLHVLQGAEALLQRSCIAFVLSEVGFSLSDTRHTNFCSLIQFLEPYGYRLLGLYNPCYYGTPLALGYANALFASPTILDRI
jgi:FkbM family methyltransferase